MNARLSVDYEVFVRRAHKCRRLEVQSADAELFRKLETLELMATVVYQNIEDYYEQLTVIKQNVMEALYKGTERIQKPVNEHSIPALIECISKARKAKNSKDLAEIIKIGLSIFAEESILI